MIKVPFRRIQQLTLIWLIWIGPWALAPAVAATGNISDAEKNAWAENAGWVNFRPTHGGVEVYETHLSGYAWAENIGWIKMGSGTGGGDPYYANTSNSNWGVNRNTAGELSGYAWSETAGWINFNPTHSQVTVDVNGHFDGYAWSENLGWIHFKNVSPAYNVQVTPYTITVNKSGLGTGTVSSSPAGIDCGPDCSETYFYITEVTLTATPEVGQDFGGWTGDLSGATNPVNTTIDSSKNVTALFTDTTPPTATVSGTVPGITNSTSATLTVGGTDVAAYQYKLDGGSYSAEIPVGTEITLSGLSEGVHTVSIIGKDAAGNWQPDAGATIFTWTVDLTPPAATIWFTDTLDSIGSVGTGTSIALDGSGGVHISYYDESNAVLKYATSALGTWSTETVDSSGAVGRFSSIALDASGYAHISYYDESNATLKYATNALGPWLKETVDTGGNVGTYSSIALDGSGVVHISYHDESNTALKYATDVAGTWNTVTIDSVGSVGRWSSIALDTSGRVHISYYDESNAALKYATNAAGTWVTETADSSGSVGEYSSIALDPLNGVHISYFDSTNQDLKVASKLLSAWSAETVDSAGNVGKYGSICVDGSGRLHIAYDDESNAVLKHASTNASGTWFTETIDGGGFSGTDPSIAVDASGHAHISYFDEGNGDLKYATSSDPPAPINRNGAVFTIGGDGVTRYKFELDGGAYSSETPASDQIILTSLPEGIHTLSVTGRDAAGNWQAETSATATTWTVDLTTPVVTSISPADNANDVGVNTVITVAFSEEMDPSTITTATFFLNDGASSIDGTLSCTGTTATFSPSSVLEYARTYTVTITTGVQDLSGNSLAANTVWSFTTEAGNLPPDLPTGLNPANETLFSAGPVTLSSNAFSDPDGDPHSATHWLVKRADRVYRCSDYDASLTLLGTATDLTQHSVSGLETGLKYIWKVGYEDLGSGETSWSREYAFKLGTSMADGNIHIAPGVEVVDFRIVSFIHWADDPSAEIVLGDEMGGSSYDEDFRIGTYDPTNGTGGYVEYGRGLKFEPGRAYWFLARNGLDITVNGVPVSTLHDMEVGLLYNSENGNGWNMIGSPNNADYRWEDVEVLEYGADGNIVSGPAPISSLSDNNPYVDKRLWRWEAGAYASDTLGLIRYNGYWVKARKENVFLRFPVGAQTTLSSPSTPLGMLKARRVLSVSDDQPPQPIGNFGVQRGRGNSSGGTGGGGCFVATAACGSPMEAHGWILRYLRDRFLRTNKLADVFVWTCDGDSRLLFEGRAFDGVFLGLPDRTKPVRQCPAGYHTRNETAQIKFLTNGEASGPDPVVSLPENLRRMTVTPKQNTPGR